MNSEQSSVAPPKKAKALTVKAAARRFIRAWDRYMLETEELGDVKEAWTRCNDSIETLRLAVKTSRD